MGIQFQDVILHRHFPKKVKKQFGTIFTCDLHVLIYDKTQVKVNEARRELFCKRNKPPENLTLTQDALLRQVKPSIFQSSIWAVANIPCFTIPSSQQWPWQLSEGP